MTRRTEFFIDIEQQNGTKVGSGPITSAIYWRQEFAMDQAGQFECAIPLSDPQALNIQSEMVLRCWAIVADQGVVQIGSGVVDNIAHESVEGGAVVRIRGLDEMRFLADRSVLFLALGGAGSPPYVSHATCVSSIASYAPPGWTFNPDPSVPFDQIIYRFRGESVLNACVQIAEFCKTHFFLSAPKTITFKSVFTPSGVTCINAPPIGHTQAPNVARISKYSFIRETKDIVSRIYGYGAWYDGVFSDYFIPLGEVNLGLGGSDPDFWPSPRYAGYPDDRVNNWIEKTSSVTAWGQREKQIQYPNIKVTFFTGGYSNSIWRSLCRLIYNRVVAELDWYGIEAQFYQLQLQNCNQVLRPLDTVRVIINEMERGQSVFKIDENLLILQSQVEVTRRGVRTTNLEVTNAERYRRRDPYATVGFQNLSFNDAT